MRFDSGLIFYLVLKNGCPALHMISISSHYVLCSDKISKQLFCPWFERLRVRYLLCFFIILYRNCGQGCSGVGTAISHLFKCGNAFPDVFNNNLT